MNKKSYLYSIWLAIKIKFFKGRKWEDMPLEEGYKK